MTNGICAENEISAVDSFGIRLSEAFGDEPRRITAEKLNVSTSIVGYWRNGNARPGYEVLLRISELYDVSIDWILGRPGAVKSRENGLDSFCLDTGLSETAAKNLRKTPYKSVMNALLGSPAILDQFEALNRLESSIAALEKDLSALLEAADGETDDPQEKKIALLRLRSAVNEDLDRVRLDRYEADEAASQANAAAYNGPRAVRKGKRILADLADK